MRNTDNVYTPGPFIILTSIIGTSAAMLQVVINPYIATYDLPGTSPVQRMNLTCGINSIGTTIGPFFVTGVIFAGVAITAVRPGQLLVPILCIAAVVAPVTLMAARANLPELDTTRSSDGFSRSVWSFSHLALGVLTIFLYVGAEVSIGVNINMHAMQLLENGGHISFLGSDSLAVGGD